MDKWIFIIYFFCNSTAARVSTIHYYIYPFVDKWIFLEPLAIWGEVIQKKANVDKVCNKWLGQVRFFEVEVKPFVSDVVQGSKTCF